MPAFWSWWNEEKRKIQLLFFFLLTVGVSVAYSGKALTTHSGFVFWLKGAGFLFCLFGLAGHDLGRGTAAHGLFAKFHRVLCTHSHDWISSIKAGQLFSSSSNSLMLWMWQVFSHHFWKTPRIPSSSEKQNKIQVLVYFTRFYISWTLGQCRLLLSPGNEMEDDTNVLCWWLCCQPRTLVRWCLRFSRHQVCVTLRGKGKMGNSLDCQTDIQCPKLFLLVTAAPSRLTQPHSVSSGEHSLSGDAEALVN